MLLIMLLFLLILVDIIGTMASKLYFVLPTFVRLDNWLNNVENGLIKILPYNSHTNATIVHFYNKIK